MKLLEIRESDLDLSRVDISSPHGSTLDSKDRHAVRSVVFNEAGNMALLYVSQQGYHKLPGGGIESREDRPTALKREIREEVGREVEIGREVGSIVEHRDAFGQRQTSDCYISTAIAGRSDQQAFTELEASQGFQLEWVPPITALALLDADTPLNYEGVFIQRRDREFLSRALNLIS